MSVGRAQIGQHWPLTDLIKFLEQGNTGQALLTHSKCPLRQVHSLHEFNKSGLLSPSLKNCPALEHPLQLGQQSPGIVTGLGHMGVGHWTWEVVMTPEWHCATWHFGKDQTSSLWRMPWGVWQGRHSFSQFVAFVTLFCTKWQPLRSSKHLSVILRHCPTPLTQKHLMFEIRLTVK